MTGAGAPAAAWFAASIAALIGVSLPVTGCSPKTPDYSSLSEPTKTKAPIEERIPVGLYLQQLGVTGEAVAPDAPVDLTVSIPTPNGWSRQKNDKLPDTTYVIGKGKEYPRAVLTVMQLHGDFDDRDAIRHAFADAELAPNFRLLDSSYEDFNGFPSAMIQGTHDLNGERVQMWSRMVFATGSPLKQHYLVQLSIVTAVEQAQAQAADAEAIMSGLVVAGKG